MMSALAEQVTLSRTRVSRLVDEMSTAGLLRREGNPNDRRSSFAVLTDLGRNTLRRAAPPYLAAIEKNFAHRLTSDELRQLRNLLARIL
jgi:DNA-binding MarR family transcriptional regulator